MKNYFILTAPPTAAMWEVITQTSQHTVRSNNTSTKYIVKCIEEHDPTAEESPLYYSAAYTEDEILVEVEKEEWLNNDV